MITDYKKCYVNSIASKLDFKASTKLISSLSGVQAKICLIESTNILAN
jgi:hypothetical protein